MFDPCMLVPFIDFTFCVPSTFCMFPIYRITVTVVFFIFPVTPVLCSTVFSVILFHGVLVVF